MSELAKTLILLAHPSIEHSRVNSRLFEIAKSIQGVSCVDLYYDYPTFNINVEAEQQRLVEHDNIIFLFPFYWYSSPAILKEWQDLVLQYGFAYGDKASALRGKNFLCAVSIGGEEKAYKSDGYNHFTLPELLRPLEQMASLTQMTYLPPFALFGSRSKLANETLNTHLKQWQSLLEQLSRREINPAKLQQFATINDYCTDILAGK